MDNNQESSKINFGFLAHTFDTHSESELELVSGRLLTSKISKFVRSAAFPLPKMNKLTLYSYPKEMIKLIYWIAANEKQSLQHKISNW